MLIGLGLLLFSYWYGNLNAYSGKVYSGMNTRERIEGGMRHDTPGEGKMCIVGTLGLRAWGLHR